MATAVWWVRAAWAAYAETYTGDVLPALLKMGHEAEYVSRELEWLSETLANCRGSA
ncbi:hypothetical protein [Pedococcus cremeus]|uniref:hypothetical protein n=1 Tax=Pedococcus cremeus TaxID=587636 RepID=UPI0015A57067|nr:hypothetical protein [Pedococcus cremeus]